MEEEGYIEVVTQGMRIMGPITTKHMASMGLGALVFSPLAVVLLLAGWFISGPHALPLILAASGLVPGLILALIPIPKRKINAMTWLYRKLRFRFRPQVFRFDRDYRQQKNHAVITAWMREVEEAIQEQQK
ncbi:hypothetical protein LLE49_20135 [Alicyclobacillus tolerans]|uniref:hypothetical protein n=1 Tax=Alicyclobacillus tolerans TaxID=90970 RepID=UPI001F35987D|nr:hypothetical protein [Alicyclobacillus tolerans]MCF8567034.1 hypothetical protein [Alicyclobacillus tolerans]